MKGLHKLSEQEKEKVWNLEHHNKSVLLKILIQEKIQIYYKQQN